MDQNERKERRMLAREGRWIAEILSTVIRETYPHARTARIAITPEATSVLIVGLKPDQAVDMQVVQGALTRFVKRTDVDHHQRDYARWEALPRWRRYLEGIEGNPYRTWFTVYQPGKEDSPGTTDKPRMMEPSPVMAFALWWFVKFVYWMFMAIGIAMLISGVWLCLWVLSATHLTPIVTTFGMIYGGYVLIQVSRTRAIDLIATLLFFPALIGASSVLSWSVEHVDANDMRIGWAFLISMWALVTYTTVIETQHSPFDEDFTGNVTSAEAVHA